MQLSQNGSVREGVHGTKKESGREPVQEAGLKIMSPDHIAQCAELAMLFELSSSPKPGNVDRCHDFSDIGFHQFLVSAVSAYPVFRKRPLAKVALVR